MSDNIVRMQHASKGLAGFSHAGASFSSDEDGIIEVQSHISDHAKAHGFVALAVKAAPKPLAKSAKGGAKEGVADDSIGDGSDKLADGDEGKELKRAEKGAKSAKGGAE